MLEITHSHVEGTIIHGTARGDGSADVMKAKGWRWGRSIGAWYVPYSRDRLPKGYLIEETAKALRAAGFEVTVSIDVQHRSTADVEADLEARRAARADALAAKADRKAGAADEAWSRADRAREALPPGGEPVKLGHHSAPRHLRAIDKAWSTLGAAVTAEQAKDEAQRRAEIASTSTQSRYSPVTVGNRIEKLAAELRDRQRKLDGYSRTVGSDGQGRKYVDEFPPASGAYRTRLEAEKAELEDELTYWQGVRASQITNGEIQDYNPATIATNDQVRVQQSWYKVVRVNAKSVTVAHGSIPGRTYRVPFHEIRGHKAG